MITFCKIKSRRITDFGNWRSSASLLYFIFCFFSLFVCQQAASFLRNSIKQLCCPLFFISYRYTFTSLISWIDPCHFFHPMTVNCQGLRKLKKCKGYASQSHFIGIALQCFTCLCSCVVVLRKALERLPKGR